MGIGKCFEYESSDLRPPNSNLFLADELGSQLAFIRPIRSVQFRSLQLQSPTNFALELVPIFNADGPVPNQAS